MTDAALADLAALVQTALVAGTAVFLRVGAAIAVLPAFGERSVPMRLRLVLALAFTLVVAPAVADRVTVADMRGLLPLFATETLVGLAFGLLLRLFIFALQVAGAIAAQSTSLAQLFGNSAAEPQPAIGHVLVVGGLALAAMADLHLHVARALIDTYDIFPPGTLIPADRLAAFGVGRIAATFALGFTLAAPFVLAAFVYNLALGAINRAMPQLMVAFVGAPAITGAGLALLALTAPMLLEVWRAALAGALADPFGAL
jgi:flagellar biosynthetic protein FliR